MLRAVVALLTAFLFSMSVKACPDLTGNYFRCIPGNGSLDTPEYMNVSQKVENGITIYTITTKHPNEDEFTSDFKVDGKQVINRDSELVSVYQLSCNGDTLINDVNVFHLRRGDVQTIEFKMSLKDGDLINEMKTQYRDITNSDSYTCLRDRR